MPPKVIPPDALHATLTALRDVEWHWESSNAPQLAERLGWAVLEVVDDDGIVVTPHWGLSRNEINIPFSDGRVDRIIMRITDIASEPSDEDSDALQDAFVSAVQAAEEVFGSPTSQTPGEEPEVRWRGHESTISVLNTRLAVNIVWSDNRFQDLVDSLEDEG